MQTKNRRCRSASPILIMSRLELLFFAVGLGVGLKQLLLNIAGDEFVGRELHSNEERPPVIELSAVE